MKVICSAFMIFVCNIPSSIEDIWCKGKKKKTETQFHNKIQSGKSSLVCWDVFGSFVTRTLPPGSRVSWWAPWLWVVSQEDPSWFLELILVSFIVKPIAPQGRDFVPTRKRLLNKMFVIKWAFDGWWATPWRQPPQQWPSTREEPSCGGRPS